MFRFLKIAALCMVAVLFVATPGMAQDAEGAAFSMNFTPSFGAGLVIIGAGLGIAKIGGAAVESMARQPEASNDIRGAMLLAAALIEGVTLLALIVCLLAVFS